MSNDDYRDRRDPYFNAGNEPPPNTRHNDDELREYRSPPDSDDRTRYSRDSAYPNDVSRDRTVAANQRPEQSYRDDNRPLQSREDQRDHHSHNRPRGDEHLRGVTYPVKFHGKTSEYFKIWIVNIFLTIITLYVYSAWAKVRTKRYFYGNTTIDNSSFEYHARGGQLVVGRLIAAILVVTYTVFQGLNLTISTVAFGILVVMFPWAIWRSLRFNARASSFRNIRFGFDGKATPPYLNLLIIPAVVIGLYGLALYLISALFDVASLEKLTNLELQVQLMISVGTSVALVLAVILVVPLLHKNLISYSLNNHRYGTAKFSAPIRTGRIYGIYLLTALITAVAIAAIGAVVSGAFWFFKQIASLLDNSDFIGGFETYLEIIFGAAVYLVVIPITAVGVAYFRSSIRNHRYNATSIDSSIKLNSTTTTWSLWWLNISNLLMLILSIGFAYPYTKIRSARYFADRTSVTVNGGLNSFTEREKARLHAMGEEMADAFDVEFDIGI